MDVSIDQDSGLLPRDLRCITLAPDDVGQWRVTCKYASGSIAPTEFVFQGGERPQSWLSYLLMNTLKFDTESAQRIAVALFDEQGFRPGPQRGD